MNKTKVTVYTSPTCGACRMVKLQIPGSKYEELFEERSIHGAEGKENLDYIKEKGFSSIPVIKIFNDEKEVFHVGFIPMVNLIQKIEDFMEGI